MFRFGFREVFLRKSISIVSLISVSLLAQPVFAQSGSDSLAFFKNYFVTGDYVVGGVGLRGLGDVTGFATGTISIPDQNSVPSAGVPDGADIVGAFLYWQTVEKSQSAQAGVNGFFNGYAITGKVLGNDTAPVSWSGGGCAGSSNGTTTLRSYRADVRPFLKVVNGVVQGNASYQVRLADSGSNGGGAPLTLGATLVLVYRVKTTTPAFPLSAVVLYDGAFAPSNTSPTFNQTIQGFYQAAVSAPVVAKLTHIAGNGQVNKSETVSLNGQPLPSLYAGNPPVPSLTPNDPPFPGFYNGSWDNPTWVPTSGVVNSSDSIATTIVGPTPTNSGCPSWAAVVFKVNVQASDHDALLNVWKTNQGYNDIKDGSFVPLPGATNGQQDIFVQIDYLNKTGDGAHSHLPKREALDKVGDAFFNHGIHVYFDVGNNYQGLGDPYIIANGTGGNVIDEDSIACHDSATLLCQYQDQPGIVSWKGGFLNLKNQPLNYPNEASCETAATGPCLRRFARGKKDSYHYVIFGHALGLSSTSFSTFSGSLVSIVVSSGTGTVTTSTPHGLSPGMRVAVEAAIGDFDLNGTYIVQSTPTATTFTITTPNVVPGTYGPATEPYLAIAFGPVRSTSGWSDLAGGDSIVTLGLWRSDVAADDQVGSVQMQAGTLMHEIGHTLGLTHGGFYFTTPGSFVTTAGLNCKSNFQSVMNYLFQIRGLTGGAVDYSDRILDPLNEANLNEANGLGSVPSAYSSTKWYAPLSFLDQKLQTAVGGRAATMHCDGTPLLPTDSQTVKVEGTTVSAGLPVAIDWNQNGTATDSGYAQDINFNGASNDSPFAGFNDWVSVNLEQMGARRNFLGFSSDVWGSQELGGGGSQELGGGGSQELGGGGSQELGGGGSQELGGGGEEDFDHANSTVDSAQSFSAVQVGHTVKLSWTHPGFGQIRTYYIWRAVGAISPSNLPSLIGKMTGTPPGTTFTDTNVKNKTTYRYFVTGALGNGNQSGKSDVGTVTVIF